jgi:hypothetical protein
MCQVVCTPSSLNSKSSAINIQTATKATRSKKKRVLITKNEIFFLVSDEFKAPHSHHRPETKKKPHSEKNE